MQLDKPHLKVTYNGTNITHDVSKSLIAFTYTDHLDEADTLDIQIEDSDLLWQGDWYPEKGAKITAEIGIEGEAVINCGTFEIDEIELSGAPDTVNIRCIAAGFLSGKKRTRKSHVHEEKTLAEIVRTVASACGLTVEGKISSVRVGRMVQRKEHDLRFLRRLATEYGYTLNVRDKKAIFISTKELEERGAVKSFDKSDLLNYSIRDKSTHTYALASVKYHNPKTSELVEHQESEGGVKDTDDVLELKHTAETKAQAIMMTQAALNKANKLQQTGNISLPGEAVLCAGNVIELTGLGFLSGKYIIKSSAHTIGISEGWLVDAEVYKVGYVEESKKRPKKKKEQTIDLS
ncbi:MAG: hypothetical protein JSS64_07120 [Bacteroidetes bacterium]|nr:hypothetical protein [Bacteroidota bacterium]